jgi:V8-like Glu-specific endopeptidase
MRRTDVWLGLALTLMLALPCCTHPADPELLWLEQAVAGGTKDTTHAAVGAVSGKYGGGCTATLIGRRTVLTAAHCVTKDKPYDVAELPVTFTDHRGFNFEAEAAVVTPLIPGSFVERDLAIVRLKTKVPGVVPSYISTQAPKSGETITLVGRGWGGLSEFPGVTRVGTNTVTSVTPGSFTFSNTAGAAICKGDSGGPSYALRGGQDQVVGVHSAGTAGECGAPYGTGFDTRVDAHNTWIVQQAQGDLYKGEPIDTDPPEVTILAPHEGDEVPRAITVKVQANDNVGVVGVVLKLDGTEQRELAQPPFEFKLEGLSRGSHTIVAEARDAEENQGQAQVVVSLRPGRPFGESCEVDDDCESNLCRGGQCTQGCSSLKACPGGYECESLACVPTASSGGCVAVPQGASIDYKVGLMLLFLLGVVRHRSTVRSNEM